MKILHEKRPGTWATGLLLLLAGAALAGCGGGDGVVIPPGADPFAAADMARGGLLYDKWWTINGGAEPATTHPDYPSPPGIRTGSTTWRCKECHGWDYMGAAGAYGGGSHFTGLDGVYDDRNDDQNALFTAIKGGAGGHDFSGVLSDADVWDLVKFVKQGQVDMTTHIVLATKVALGNAVVGKPLYEANCVGCHGHTGKKINLEHDTPATVYEGVGGVANGNPWETLHKIRWGHPGSPMPSMVTAGLTEADHGDILAYGQGLPQGTTPLSYATDIHPLWTALGCTACHTPIHPSLDLTGTAPVTLAALQGLAGAIDSANEVNSNLLRKPLAVAGGGVAHGGGDSFATTADPTYRFILQWLEEGEAP